MQNCTSTNSTFRGIVVAGIESEAIDLTSYNSGTKGILVSALDCTFSNLRSYLSGDVGVEITGIRAKGGDIYAKRMPIGSGTTPRWCCRITGRLSTVTSSTTNGGATIIDGEYIAVGVVDGSNSDGGAIAFESACIRPTVGIVNAGTCLVVAQAFGTWVQSNNPVIEKIGRVAGVTGGIVSGPATVAKINIGPMYNNDAFTFFFFSSGVVGYEVNYNCTVTRSGVGIYRVNYTNPLSSRVCFPRIECDSGILCTIPTRPEVTYCDLEFRTVAGVLTDPLRAMFSVTAMYQ